MTESDIQARRHRRGRILPFAVLLAATKAQTDPRTSAGRARTGTTEIEAAAFSKPSGLSPWTAHLAPIGSLPPKSGLFSTACGVLALIALGCTNLPPLADSAERRPLGGELRTYTPPALGDLRLDDRPANLRADDVVAVDELSLRDALTLALERSPRLAGFAWEVRSRQGRAVQAGLFPNPVVDVSVEDFAGSGSLSGFGDSETTLQVAQQIPTAGKRVKSRRAADLAAEVGVWEYESARLEMYASVAQAFADVLAAQQTVAMTERLAGLANDAMASVSKLVESGAMPAVEKTRAALEVAALRVDLKVARRSLKASRAALAATWGDAQPRFEAATGDLGVVVAPPATEQVRGLIVRNPILRRWEREVERLDAVRELERARRIPDVTVGAGVRRAQAVDETALVAGISIPIPLFDRNQGNRAAAHADLLRARHQYRETEVRLAAELEQAHQEWLARFEEVSELRNSILPSAEEAYRGVRSGFQRGLFRNVDVLDAQRRLFQLRLREISALRGYRLAEAEVERITGTPLGSNAAGNTGESQ